MRLCDRSSQFSNHPNCAQIPPELAAQMVVSIGWIKEPNPGKRGSNKGDEGIMRIFFTCIAMCIVLLSIASAETPQPAGADLVEVSRADGSVQCGDGPAITLAESVAEVEAANIEVFSARTAHDGRKRIAMCGASTGRVHILSIESGDLDRVQGLGFVEFSIGND